MRFSWPLLFVLLGGVSCIPLPYAAPPLRLDIAGGAAVGEPDGKDQSTRQPLQLRVATQPAGLIESAFDRRLDFGGGYILEVYTDGRPEHARHGGFLRGSWHPYLGSAGASGQWRWSVEGSVELFDANEDRLGYGASVGTAFEILTFAGTDTHEGGGGEGGAIFGVHHGEGGIGLAVNGSYRHMPGRDYFLVTGGLVLRSPAAAGVLLIPLWKLFD